MKNFEFNVPTAVCFDTVFKTMVYCPDRSRIELNRDDVVALYKEAL